MFEICSGNTPAVEITNLTFDRFFFFVSLSLASCTSSYAYYPFPFCSHTPPFRRYVLPPPSREISTRTLREPVPAFREPSVHGNSFVFLQPKQRCCSVCEISLTAHFVPWKSVVIFQDTNIVWGFVSLLLFCFFDVLILLIMYICIGITVLFLFILVINQLDA